MNQQTENRAESEAEAQYQSILSMLAAVDVDYDRLEELRQLKAEAETCGNDAGGGDGDPVISGAELEAAASGCESEFEARQRIAEDPLCVDVRSDWQSMGEELTPAEFRILLCTGGPAVQIRGELGEYREPVRAWIEYQDWGTPWTQFYGASSDALINYSSHFLGQ